MGLQAALKRVELPYVSRWIVRKPGPRPHIIHVAGC